MATNRYLGLTTGNGITEVVPATTGGASASGQIVALTSSGLIDTSMLPAGTGSVDTVQAVAGVAISAGNFVNLYNNAGVLTAKLADASTGLPADGYVLAAIASAATGTVNLNDQNSALTALTPGTTYYLSTAGAVTLTPQTTAGYISQVVGKSVSATALQFRPGQPVTLA